MENPRSSSEKGFLGFIERTGNRLPDPVFIFVYLIVILLAISVVCAWVGVSADLVLIT